MRGWRVRLEIRIGKYLNCAVRINSTELIFFSCKKRYTNIRNIMRFKRSFKKEDMKIRKEMHGCIS